MSVEVMSQVWKHSTASEGSLLVLLAIADFADDDGCAWPSRETLAKKARLSVRQVSRIIARLVEDGELVIERTGVGRGHSNRYRIVMKQGQYVPIPEPEKVTLATVKGDASVTRTIIEPPVVRKANALLTSGESQNGNGHHRDLVWDEMQAIFGEVPPRTNAHGKRNKAVADLKRMAATPDTIRRAHQSWSKLFEGATCTDTALATHYPQLVSDPAGLSAIDRLRMQMAERGVQ